MYSHKQLKVKLLYYNTISPRNKSEFNRIFTVFTLKVAKHCCEKLGKI